MPVVTNGNVIYVITKLKVCRVYFHLARLSCPYGAVVSPAYFCNLDGNLMRLDHLQRPELNKGTVDFAVSEEYWALHPPHKLTMPYFSTEPQPSGSRPPMPMNYVFAFDVSHEAIQSGLLRTACGSLLTILYGGVSVDDSSLDPCFPKGSRLAVLTFDQTIHFHDLSVCYFLSGFGLEVHIRSVSSGTHVGPSRPR